MQSSYDIIYPLVLKSCLNAIFYQIMAISSHVPNHFQELCLYGNTTTCGQLNVLKLSTHYSEGTPFASKVDGNDKNLHCNIWYLCMWRNVCYFNMYSISNISNLGNITVLCIHVAFIFFKKRFNLTFIVKAM